MTRRSVLICLFWAFLSRDSVLAKTAKRSRRGPRRSPTPPKPEPPKGPPENHPVATLKDSMGKAAGGLTTLSGRWAASSDGKDWCARSVPLVDAWCVFGPEIREKSARVEARVIAPGQGRILSRFGVGLYGKNGVQWRTAPSRNEMELIRRGAVLARVEFAQKLGEPLHLELSVTQSGTKWEVSGRVWRDQEDRPKEALLSHRLYEEELEVPLAGQAVLTAAAFSGEAVQFTEASVFEHPEPVPEKKKGDNSDHP